MCTTCVRKLQRCKNSSSLWPALRWLTYFCTLFAERKKPIINMVNIHTFTWSFRIIIVVACKVAGACLILCTGKHRLYNGCYWDATWKRCFHPINLMLISIYHHQRSCFALCLISCFRDKRISNWVNNRNATRS